MLRIPKTSILLAALYLLTTAITAVAGTLTGTVVAIADGDTITVLDEDKHQHRIRVAGIDAPEKRQPFGERAKQHLASLVFGKQVAVTWDKQDRYGRTVGKIAVGTADAACRGCTDTLDAGLALIAAGLAWHYKHYQSEQSPEDRGRYAAEESVARQEQRGLWREPAPTPPWEWRRQQRSGHQ